MNINTRLVGTLAVVSGSCWALMFAILVWVSFDEGATVPDAVGGALAVTAYVSMLWLYIYWLVYLHRSKNRPEFWACLLLPYVYAFAKSISVLSRK